jgi:Transcriptional regulator LmrA/YxaF-like, C-terminal domain
VKGSTAAARVFTDWVDGGTAYFHRRGLDEPRARELTLALIGTLEGAFVLARTLRSTEPLLAAGQALAPQYRGVELTIKMSAWQ